MLKGDYLKSFGFNIDTKVSGQARTGRIIITLLNKNVTSKYKVENHVAYICLIYLKYSFVQ